MPSTPSTSHDPQAPHAPPGLPTPRRSRLRVLAPWAAALALALLLIGMAAQWAAVREARFQADSIRRAMEVHVLGDRKSVV